MKQSISSEGWYKDAEISKIGNEKAIFKWVSLKVKVKLKYLLCISTSTTYAIISTGPSFVTSREWLQKGTHS